MMKIKKLPFGKLHSSHEQASDSIEKITMIESEILERAELVYQLVRKPAKKKLRKCLCCGVLFVSAGLGNRQCGSCAAMNKRASVRAQSPHIPIWD